MVGENHSRVAHTLAKIQNPKAEIKERDVQPSTFQGHWNVMIVNKNANMKSRKFVIIYHQIESALDNKLRDTFHIDQINQNKITKTKILSNNRT